MNKSKRVLERALKVMPGGVSSPVRALKAVEGDPLFINKASGSHVTDVDNRRYIDLCMSFGPLILGHSSKIVTNKLCNQIKIGTSYGITTKLEVDLAEKITKYHPATDWVRFVNSGTEAVMSAIRLARGHTGRDLIIKFSGCYHGHADSMLVKAGSGLATFGISSSKGVPSSVSKNTIVLKLNDLDGIKAAFENHGDQIAGTVIEGVPANNGLLIQSKPYMQELEKITQKNGSLFILDEVITGFRIGLDGASGYYGLKPDLVTFGKVIGGGLPVGAYGGRRDLIGEISPLGDVYQAGTLSGNPLAMAAGNATLDYLIENPVFEELDKLGSSFEKKAKISFENNGLATTIVRIGSVLWMLFQSGHLPKRPEDVQQPAVERYKKFHKLSLVSGLYMPPSAYEVMFLSTAHSEDVLNNIIEIFDKVGSDL